MVNHNTPPEISVIVPVYNAEKFLRETLDSILAQTFEDFELICVDDGSTDSSLKILNAYGEKDPRVRILRQQNQYAGIARNNGIKHARGKWLMFLDADDLFAPELLEKMYGKAEQDDADICVVNADYYHEKHKKIKEGKNFIIRSLIPEETPFSKDDIEGAIFNFTSMHVWNKLFKADFIREHKIEFAASRVAEDVKFVLSALLLAQRITVVDERLIRYRVGTNESATDKVSQDILVGHEALLREKQNMISRGLYSEKVKKSFANKALGNSFHFFNRCTTLESFIRLYNRLVFEGGLEELDIHVDEAYYNEKHRLRLCAMQECGDAYEYLFRRYRAEMQTKDKLSYDKADLKRKLKEEQAKVKVLKEKNRALKEKNAIQKEKLADMRNSYTFRIGKVIMFLPHMLKRMFQRVR